MSATLEGWLAWPSRTLVAAVILEPHLVVSDWTAVGGGSPNSYQASVPRFVLEQPTGQVSNVQGDMLVSPADLDLYTFPTYAVPAGTDKLLVVWVFSKVASGNTEVAPTGVTHDGVALTKRGEFIESGRDAVSLWDLPLGTTTPSGDVVVTWAADNGRNNQGVAILTLHGMQQQAPEAIASKGDGGTTQLDTPIATLTKKALVLDGFISTNDQLPASSYAEQAQQFLDGNPGDGNAASAGVSTVATDAPAIHTLGWTLPQSARCAHLVAAYASVTGIAGGIYQKVVGLTENATPLTAQASLAAVDANAGSWYWDEANGVLYAHSSTGSDPDTFTIYFAQVQFFVSSDGRVIDLTDDDPSSGVPFRPWLPGDVPAVSRQMENFFTGVKITATSQLPLINASFALYRLLASEGDYWWKNTRVRIYLGGDYADLTLPWSEYLAYLTMLVEDVACDDEEATFELKPLARRLQVEVPPTPYFESSYPNLGEGVRGRKIPIGYGRAIRRPDLTDTTVSDGRWTIADAAFQTLFAVHSVTAIAKSNGARTLLTITTDYTVDLTGCTVTVVNPTYNWADYDLEADVTGKPDGAGSYLQTVGEIVEDLLLTFAGATADDLDTAAFAQADLDASQELAVWLPDGLDGSARSLAAVISSSQAANASIEGSVMATLKQTPAGLWTIAVWDPGYDAATVVHLAAEDFTEFRPEPKLETIYSTARVYYDQNHSTGAWSSESTTDARTKFLSKSADIMERRTFLRSGADAQSLAQRALFMAGAQGLEIEVRLTTPKLAQLIEGDKVLVTRTPAPAVSGSFSAKLFELLRLDLAPDLAISARLGDLRGIGDIIGHWTDASAPDWASATEEERGSQGFWSDSAGLIDPADPATANQSVWW
jgi:hypothetical protein